MLSMPVVVSVATLAQAVMGSPCGTKRAPAVECTDVHLFVARGSNEEVPGRQGALADALCAAVPSCSTENVQYPATLDNYCSSVSEGVASALQALEAYAAACPDAKLVLTGYSQGAHLVGDALSGGGGAIPDANCTQATSAPLSKAVGDKIAAITLFGDVRHVPDQKYNLGAGAGKPGIYPRSGAALDGFNVYADHVSSWCNGEDPVCASGNDVAEHLTYLDQFTADAVAFIQTKL